MLLKICGITNQEDASAAERAGADLVGFIFHPSSPRYISPEQVKNITTCRAARVGVFVNETVEEILKIASCARLDFIQLHGDFSPEDCSRIGASRVIKVLWPERYSTIEEFLSEVDKYFQWARYILLDAGVREGGHGRSIRSISHIQSLPRHIPWIMAGGISMESIDRLSCLIKPLGWDVSSSIEAYPGKKDHNKLIKLAKKIKEMI